MRFACGTIQRQCVSGLRQIHHHKPGGQCAIAIPEIFRMVLEEQGVWIRHSGSSAVDVHIPGMSPSRQERFRQCFIRWTSQITSGMSVICVEGDGVKWCYDTYFINDKTTIVWRADRPFHSAVRTFNSSPPAATPLYLDSEGEWINHWGLSSTTNFHLMVLGARQRKLEISWLQLQSRLRSHTTSTCRDY